MNPNFALAVSGNYMPLNSDLVAKKSGGRSGGGSFKSRPSRSSSPKRSSPSRSNYNRRTASPTYRNRNNTTIYPSSRSTSNAGTGAFWFLFIFLFIVGVLIYLTYQVFNNSSNSSNQTANKIIRERDNDRVTVSLLQIALSSNADHIQQALSELSLNTDTSTESGLVSLMQESALILLRNESSWTHVLSSSSSLDIEGAESAFDKLSIVERSKFSSESLSNVDGTLKTRTTASSDDDELAYYIVVTLIVGTADDKPLFEKINTETALREALLQLASMRDDYLMKLELLWTPQQAGEYLTDEELLLEYTKIVPLA